MPLGVIYPSSFSERGTDGTRAGQVNSCTLAERTRTFIGYKQHVEKNIVPVIGSIGLQKLTGMDVQRLVNEKAVKMAPRTVRYMRSVLRTALNDAVKWDCIPKNPAQRVSLPRAKRHEFHVLDPEQARKFLEVTGESRVGPLYSVALGVGLRLGEALGLKWEDIDLDRKTLAVKRALQRVDKQLTFVEPKSETSRRTVVLPDFAVEALKRHRTAQKRERLIAGGDWKDWGLVFANPTGTPLDNSKLLKEFKATLKAAGLPDLRLHDLRHTCATLLLVQGVHPKLVQETLGHSQISLTLDTYSHMVPGLREEVAKKMDDLMTATAS